MHPGAPARVALSVPVVVWCAKFVEVWLGSRELGFREARNVLSCVEENVGGLRLVVSKRRRFGGCRRSCCTGILQACSEDGRSWRGFGCGEEVSAVCAVTNICNTSPARRGVVFEHVFGGVCLVES